MPGVLDRIDATHKARTAVEKKALYIPTHWSDGARVSLVSHAVTPWEEGIGNDFESYVEEAYKSNGVVFACAAARSRIFSQGRFQFQEYNSDSSGTRPGKLFGSPALDLLDRPWSGVRTSTLLAYMEVDASFAGNSFWTTVDDAGRVGRRATGEGRCLIRMRPDWVKIIAGSPEENANPWDIRTRVVAYAFSPPGNQSGPLILLPEEVVHYAPIPDPTARFRGMSWLTPVIREIEGDGAMTAHKTAFLKNGATPNLAVTLETEDPDEFKAFVESFRNTNEGAKNAYKTIFVGAGADVKAMGVDFKQLEFSNTQGKGETRIASAAGVHPTIVGLSEGLQGSSLNAGNFGAARRLLVDMTIRDLWEKAGAALETVAKPPRKLSRLVVDERDIPFLHEDAKDRADTQFIQAQAIRQLIDGGFKGDESVKAIMSADLGLLVGAHTGMLSVQLRKPGEGNDESTGDNSQANGRPPGVNGARVANANLSLNGAGPSGN